MSVPANSSADSCSRTAPDVAFHSESFLDAADRARRWGVAGVPHVEIQEGRLVMQDSWLLAGSVQSFCFCCSSSTLGVWCGQPRSTFCVAFSSSWVSLLGLGAQVLSGLCLPPSPAGLPILAR